MRRSTDFEEALQRVREADRKLAAAKADCRCQRCGDEAHNARVALRKVDPRMDVVKQFLTAAGRATDQILSDEQLLGQILEISDACWDALDAARREQASRVRKLAKKKQARLAHKPTLRLPAPQKAKAKRARR